MTAQAEELRPYSFVIRKTSVAIYTWRFCQSNRILKERRTLNPSDDTIERLIQTQREKARKYILEKIHKEIFPPIKLALDDLLIVGTESRSKLHQIKEVLQKPSAAAIKTLANKLVMRRNCGN